MAKASFPRLYRGQYIWPKNVFGMYSAVVNCQPLAADTFEGMKALIRHTLGKG